MNGKSTSVSLGDAVTLLVIANTIGSWLLYTAKHLNGRTCITCGISSHLIGWCPEGSVQNFSGNTVHAPTVANSERAGVSVVFLGLNGAASFHRLSTAVIVVIVGSY